MLLRRRQGVVRCLPVATILLLLMQEPHQRWCPTTPKNLSGELFVWQKVVTDHSKINSGGTQMRSAGAHISLCPSDSTQSTFLTIQAKGPERGWTNSPKTSCGSHHHSSVCVSTPTLFLRWCLWRAQVRQASQSSTARALRVPAVPPRRDRGGRKKP